MILFSVNGRALLRAVRSSLGYVVVCVAALSGTAFAQTADLILNHQDSPDPGPAGGSFTYTMRIDNLSSNAAAGVTLADTLPTNAQFQSLTTSQGSCTSPAVGSGGAVNCTLGTIAANAFATVAVVVKLPTAGTYTNNATVGSTTTDPNTANNSFAQTTTATTAADLSLAVVTSTATPAAGAPYTYTLTVNNAGPDGLELNAVLRISFTVPTGSSFTGFGGSGWTCAPAFPVAAGTVVNCSNTLAAGLGQANAPPLTITSTANASGGISANFSTSATRGDGSTVMPDGNLSNNTASATVTAGSGTDVSISQTRSPSTVALGSNVTYQLTPRLNGGEQPGGTGTQLITVTDTLDANLTYVNASGSGWNCSPPPGPVVTCTRPGPYTGGNFTDMPVITLVATANGVGTLVNQAVISLPAGETDSVPANNTSSANVVSTNEADLRMNKSASLNPVVVGENFTYSLSVTNLGPLAITGTQTITVSDTLPANVQLVSNPTGTGWVCGNTGLGTGETISCTRTGASLPSGSNTNTITVSVRQTSPGGATNSATVALSGAGPTDSNAANNTASATTSATVTGASVDLSVTKMVSSQSVASGSLLTYTIFVTNRAATTATNVIVTDVLTNLLPDGGLVSATAFPGSCSPTAGNGPNRTVNCNIGSLPQGYTATVTLVVRPVLPVTANLTNTATATSTDQGDTERADNSSSVTSEVTALVDIRATKSATPSTATPGTVPAGAPLTYTVAVINDGPSTAQAVQMTDTLPANGAFINLVSVDGGGTCVPPAANAVGGSVVCNWTSIPTGTQRTVTYRIRPLVSAVGGTVVNSVAVTTTTPESNGGNNGATTSTAVTAANLDILVNKSDTPDPVALGALTTYTVTVTNNGPSFGTNVVLTDVFPAPGSTPSAVFSYQGALTVNTNGTCTQPTAGATSGTVSCTFPVLASGQTATVTYQMRAESIIGAGLNSGTLPSRASVSVAEAETQLANNVAIENTTTNRAPVATDLQITKTAGATAVTRGGTIAYTLTVLNNGPLANNSAQVVDALPAGLTFVSAPSCVAAGNTVSCDVGALAVGTSRVFTVTATLDTAFVGSTIANTATVNAPGDTVPGNNSSTVTTQVTVMAPTSIPTLSEWALIMMSGMLGLLAWGTASRRKSSH